MFSRTFFLISVFCLLISESHAQTLRVDQSVCRQLVTYEKPAGVDYQAGFDARGNKVVPADMNAAPVFDFEKEIRIKLTNQTAKIFGLKLPEVTVKKQDGSVEKLPMVDPEMEIGYVTLKKGQPYLNGKPLQNAANRALYVLCGSQKGEKLEDIKEK